jgi:hypothetical protein
MISTMLFVTIMLLAEVVIVLLAYSMGCDAGGNHN